MMDQYLALGFDTEEYVFQAAIGALNRYIEFQHSVDYDVTEIENVQKSTIPSTNITKTWMPVQRKRIICQ